MSQGNPPPSVPGSPGDESPEAALRDRIAELESEVMRNRTAMAERQSRLLRLQRRLSRSERLSALAALVERLAHDLGTPLHSIGGHLDLLSTDPELSPSARDRVSLLAGEVQRLSQLIRDQIETLHAPAPQPVPTDVNECVGRVAALVEPVLGQRAISLTLDLEAAAAEPFPCDPARIEQVAMNLVQNAMDAMPKGGVLVLRTSTTGTGRTVSVADSGQGMEPDVLEQAGTPFFTTKQAGRGTGLGLMICEEIAREHGGELLIDSKPGMGTVVTVALARPVEATPPGGTPDPAEGAAGG